MNERKNLTIMDYFALYQMSLRSYFWRVDGRQVMKKIGGDLVSDCIYIISALFSYGMPLIILLLAYQTVRSLVLTPISAITGAYASSVSFGSDLFTLIFAIVLFLMISPLVLNKERFKYNLHFKESAWWKNTGIRPSRIKKDKGLYGEYIATMAAEQCLKNNGVYGKIFNNVIVPKKGADYAEIDILSVNETGIHVIEAKARGGAFYGKFLDKKWRQVLGTQQNEMENPVIQNLGHCNALSEYLNQKLPDGTVKNKATYVYNFINVALLVIFEIEDHLDHSVAPSEYFFGMAEGRQGYQHCNIVKAYKKRFTREEIDEIAKVIEPVACYTEQERAAKLQARETMYNNSSYESPIYSMVELNCTETDGSRVNCFFICKKERGYRTYYDMQDTLFKAIPNSTIISEEYETYDFRKALDYFNTNVKC